MNRSEAVKLMREAIERGDNAVVRQKGNRKDRGWTVIIERREVSK